MSTQDVGGRAAVSSANHGQPAAWVRGIVPALLVAVLLGVTYVRWRAPEGTASSFADRARSAGHASGPATARQAAREADELLRQARVTSNPGLAARAEDLLKQALAREPEHYEALRAMGAVLLSQHRFREAIEIATRARAIDPADAWNEGVIGDGHLELGEYDAAFAAFDRMMQRRPTAAAYARASYARELQGDSDGALRLMRMAADSTSAHDPEGQAWHYAQIGDLLFQRGQLAAARTEYAHAEFVYPGHPFAAMGLAKVKAAEQNYAGALADYEALMAKRPTPFVAARIGELQEKLGHTAEAQRAYALAEEGWRSDTPEPTLLAAFLAAHARASEPVIVTTATSAAKAPEEPTAIPPLPGERGQGVRANGGALSALASAADGAGPASASTTATKPRAVALAEQAASTRRDIFTMDALAWARFKAGDLAGAREASSQALRTGTRDRVILYHAAAIADAAGDRASARTLVDRALDGHPTFDLVAAPEARALQAKLDGRQQAGA